MHAPSLVLAPRVVDVLAEPLSELGWGSEAIVDGADVRHAQPSGVGERHAAFSDVVEESAEIRKERGRGARLGHSHMMRELAELREGGTCYEGP